MNRDWVPRSWHWPNRLTHTRKHTWVNIHPCHCWTTSRYNNIKRRPAPEMGKMPLQQEGACLHIPVHSHSLKMRWRCTACLVEICWDPYNLHQNMGTIVPHAKLEITKRTEWEWLKVIRMDFNRIGTSTVAKWWNVETKCFLHQPFFWQLTN